MAESTIKKPYIDPYFGEHAVRIVGSATSASQVSVMIPWANPNGETPTVTNISASMTGVGDATVALDDARTNKDAVGFLLSKSGTTFTNHYSYVCLVRFTLS